MTYYDDGTCVINQEVRELLSDYSSFRIEKGEPIKYYYQSEVLEIVINYTSTFPPHLLDKYDSQNLTLSERNFRCPSICRIDIRDESLQGRGLFSSLVDGLLRMDGIDMVIVSQICNHLFHRYLRDSKRWEYLYQYNNRFRDDELKSSVSFLTNNSNVYSKILKALSLPVTSKYYIQAKEYREQLIEYVNSPETNMVLEDARKLCNFNLSKMELHKLLLSEGNDDRLCLSGVSHINEWNSLYTCKYLTLVKLIT